MIEIKIKLEVKAFALEETVTYPSGSSGPKRRKFMEEKGAIKKRSKNFHLPHHPQGIGHQTWIVRAGDQVVWECDREFMLSVDYDLEPCDHIPGSPRNPFDWPGVKKGAKEDDGMFRVRGVVTNHPEGYERAADQMFYKFTAFVEGYEPLDPDGICGYPNDGP